MKVFKLLEPEIHDLIRKHKWKALKKILVDWPVPEVAELLFDLEAKHRVLVFRLLPKPQASEVFSYLEVENQNELIKNLTDEESRELLKNLRPDDRTRFFEEMPGRSVQKALNLLEPEDLKEVRMLLGYPEESVGRLMNPDYVAVRPDWTVQRAIDHIRRRGRNMETLNTIYVTDSAWKLLDALILKRFIVADPESLVSDIMDDTFISLSPFDDREEAVRTMERYDFFVIPVVDSEGILLGTVTMDDVMDVAAAEATEDFHKSAAVAPLKTSYSRTTVKDLFMRRVGWLIALVFINLGSSGVISAFESTLQAMIALSFFIPLLIDSGGNAGAQAATLMVRALATGDVDLRDWLKPIAKEISVGLALGIAMGLASATLGFFRSGWIVGAVVGTSMIMIVLVANLIGTILPFILYRLKIDPAVASGPLITSIVDAAGLLVYFSIATWFLGSGFMN